MQLEVHFCVCVYGLKRLAFSLTIAWDLICLTTYYISPPWNVWDSLKKICPFHGSILVSAFPLHQTCSHLCSTPYHHLTSLLILLGPRVDMFKGSDMYCQIALPRDCATYIPISIKGVLISSHSHQGTAVLFANLIDDRWWHISISIAKTWF